LKAYLKYYFAFYKDIKKVKDERRKAKVFLNYSKKRTSENSEVHISKVIEF